MENSNNKMTMTNDSISPVGTMNGKTYYFGSTRNVCECCGCATHRAFYKNTKISLVKKGKKICFECIERFENNTPINEAIFAK